MFNILRKIYSTFSMLCSLKFGSFSLEWDFFNIFSAWSAMRSGIRFVIIDNDNLKYSDMLPYVSEVKIFATVLLALIIIW